MPEVAARAVRRRLRAMVHVYALVILSTSCSPHQPTRVPCSVVSVVHNEKNVADIKSMVVSARFQRITSLSDATFNPSLYPCSLGPSEFCRSVDMWAMGLDWARQLQAASEFTASMIPTDFACQHPSFPAALAQLPPR